MHKDIFFFQNSGINFVLMYSILQIIYAFQAGDFLPSAGDREVTLEIGSLPLKSGDLESMLWGEYYVFYINGK